MRTVLVTGGGGYIGSVLVPTLLDKGNHVKVVDRFFFGMDRLVDHPELEMVVDDTRRLTPQHFEGVDAVIDLAAVSNDPSGELFQEPTWAINHRARVRCAHLAKEAGVDRYLLPSSCSVYGFQDHDTISDEESDTNPLTTYAKANLAAEEGVLELADDDFCVTVIRQATVYGYSPRMRFDLAINGMTFGAWKTGRLPLMRDGSQWRPMVHVSDTSEAQCFMLDADRSEINGEIYNIGSESNVYQIGPLGEAVANTVPGDVEIEWYGDPDHRSYRVSFEKVEKLGWETSRTAEDGVAEIVSALVDGRTDRTPETLTLEWYKYLYRFKDLLSHAVMEGSLLELSEEPG